MIVENVETHSQAQTINSKSIAKKTIFHLVISDQLPIYSLNKNHPPKSIAALCLRPLLLKKNSQTNKSLSLEE